MKQNECKKQVDVDWDKFNKQAELDDFCEQCEDGVCGIHIKTDKKIVIANTPYDTPPVIDSAFGEGKLKADFSFTYVSMSAPEQPPQDED